MRESQWTALRYEMERDAAVITIEESGASSVVFRASHGLDSRFDYPLTFLVQPDGAPSSVTAKWVNTGQPVEASIQAGRILVNAPATDQPVRVSWQ